MCRKSAPLGPIGNRKRPSSNCSARVPQFGTQRAARCVTPLGGSVSSLLTRRTGPPPGLESRGGVKRYHWPGSGLLTRRRISRYTSPTASTAAPAKIEVGGRVATSITQPIAPRPCQALV